MNENLFEPENNRTSSDDKQNVNAQTLETIVGNMSLARRESAPMLAAAGVTTSPINAPAMTLRRYAEIIITPASAAAPDTINSFNVGCAMFSVSGLLTSSLTSVLPVCSKTNITSAADAIKTA